MLIFGKLLRSAFHFKPKSHLEFAIWPSCKCFSSRSVCTEYTSDRLNSNKISILNKTIDMSENTAFKSFFFLNPSLKMFVEKDFYVICFIIVASGGIYCKRTNKVLIKFDIFTIFVYTLFL